MTDAQEWLDQKYPKSGKCKFKDDNDNYELERKDIKKLDISWGKLSKSFNKSKSKKLTGSLKLTGFTQLHTLKCGSQELTSLNLNDCFDLQELNCNDNQLTSLDLTSLDVNKCYKLKKLNFSNNQLTSLDVSGLTKLEELICLKNPDLREITGLKDLRNLKHIDCGNLVSGNHSDLKPINQLRKEVKEVFLTGTNISDVDYLIGYYNNQQNNNLLDREINACQQVIDASVMQDPQRKVNFPQDQIDRAKQEIAAYQAKILQVKPWL